MGNSEVGHLTIGSGRVLDQDFQRVNRAVADGELLRERGARRRRSAAHASAGETCTCSGSSRTAASTRTSTTCARCSSSRSARAWRPHVDPRVHRRPRRLAARGACATSPSCRPTGSRRSSAATTRWTATSAGSGRELALDAIVDGDGRARRAIRVARGAGELRRRRHRRVHRARRGRRPAAARPGARRRDLLQLPARPRAPARARSSASSAST